MRIYWSDDLVVLDARAAAWPQVERMDRSTAAWVLIWWVAPGEDRPLVFVLSRDEYFQRLRLTPHSYHRSAPDTLGKVLRLQRLAPSLLVEADARPDQLPQMDSLPLAGFDADVLSGWRLAVLPDPPMGGGEEAFDEGAAEESGPQRAAVGGPDVGSRILRRVGREILSGGPSVSRGEPPLSRGFPLDSSADEGTTPLRYPSIEPEGNVTSGQPITLVVDLLREESATTLGVTHFPEMPGDWTAFPIEVALTSPDIDFDADGRATLEVRRNAASQSARVSGRVQAGLTPEHPIQVRARFLLGQRLCGSATRMLALDGAAQPLLPAGVPTSMVQIDSAAEQPDLTVEISIADPDKPTRLTWSMWSRRFEGRPAKLNGVVNLGQKPEVEASALFNQFAKLERGQHREAIEGFGEVLWDKSPSEFREMYWALCDYLKRPLTIQLISDDPYMPWELMNPYRQGEQHGPIALRHAVARWLLLYKGYMDNRLPKGSLIAMAPHYAVGQQLPLAEAAAQALVERLGARRVQGRKAEFLQLLESPPAEPVALLYFTGHGAFSTDAAALSRLKLEDGTEITPTEVKRQKVQLGERDGTVVFLNACEVGASGSVLGNVGGWADAFLSREFRAFIAPLWAIDEEDAAQATAELMDAIVTRQQPLGEALRDLRAKYGEVSPTFYSYLLYGDVTARLGTG